MKDSLVTLGMTVGETLPQLTEGWIKAWHTHTLPLVQQLQERVMCTHSRAEQRKKGRATKFNRRTLKLTYAHLQVSSSSGHPMGLCGMSEVHSMTHYGSVLTEVSTLDCKTMQYQT